MSSSTNFCNSILNIQPSELTHTTSGDATNVSVSDHTVDPRSDSSSYAWGYPRVLDISSCFRGPNDLDKFLSKVSFLKPNSPSDDVIADICNYTD